MDSYFYLFSSALSYLFSPPYFHLLRRLVIHFDVKSKHDKDKNQQGHYLLKLLRQEIFNCNGNFYADINSDFSKIIGIFSSAAG